MVAAIRQIVTVGPGGRVEVQSPQLKEGARAEVIVMLEDAAAPSGQLAAFDRLQKRLNLDPQRAHAWSAQVRDERQSFGPRE